MAGFEDLVTLGLIGTGILGGVVLHIRTRAAPIVVAVFLSTGIAGAVYRFLGGIEASFNVRGLQITGTMAALVGFCCYSQPRPRQTVGIPSSQRYVVRGRLVLGLS
jgi:hypothetical protein